MAALAMVAPDKPGEALVPPVPESIEDTGLASSVIEQLLMKLLYYRGELSGRDLAKAIGLKFSLIEELLENAKRLHQIQVKKSLGMGNISSIFALSEAGRTLAREYLENNQYTGAAPVPLYQYSYIIKRQRRKEGWLKPDALNHAYRHAVTTPQMLAQIGPAVSSGNSFLVYGQAGNGKTFMAEALAGIDDDAIYVPFAIESQGSIIQVFDPIYHQPIAGEEEITAFRTEEAHDGRWLKCKRPFIVTGGELSPEMLDLNYNHVSKIYDAPYQLKANNGIYLIDDFGRQRCTPAEILNRWIVPMERRVDYLSFRTGGKMTVPFEAFLIFSTNLSPSDLGDDAFLRRIQYKMLVRNPAPDEFIRIFLQFCAARELACDEQTVNRFIERHYRTSGKPMRRCQPRDVLSHAIHLMQFEGLPMQLTDLVLDRAFESCFAQDVEE